MRSFRRSYRHPHEPLIDQVGTHIYTREGPQGCELQCRQQRVSSPLASRMSTTTGVGYSCRGRYNHVDHETRAARTITMQHAMESQRGWIWTHGLCSSIQKRRIDRDIGRHAGVPRPVSRQRFWGEGGTFESCGTYSATYRSNIKCGLAIAPSLRHQH